MTIRLMVIDDSATVRALIEHVVEQDPDCSVVGVAPDVEVAREMMERLRPDVLTLDLHMPGTNGLDFLTELANGHHAPIVVLSSSTQADSAATREALARGADACFDKTRILAEAPRLRRVLRQAVERRRRRQRAGKAA